MKFWCQLTNYCIRKVSNILTHYNCRCAILYNRKKAGTAAGFIMFEKLIFC